MAPISSTCRVRSLRSCTSLSSSASMALRCSGMVIGGIYDLRFTIYERRRSGRVAPRAPVGRSHLAAIESANLVPEGHRLVSQHLAVDRAAYSGSDGGACFRRMSRCFGDGSAEPVPVVCVDASWASTAAFEAVPVVGGSSDSAGETCT